MAGKRTMGTTLTKKKSGDELADLKIANLTSIGEIGIESEEIDVTDHDSEGNFNEFIASTKDAGEVAIAGNLNLDTDFEKLLSLANAQEIHDWTIEYPTGAKWEFKAFVKSIKDGEKTPDGVATFTGSLRVSGAPTFTPKA